MLETQYKNKKFDDKYIKNVRAFTWYLLWGKYKKRASISLILFVVCMMASYLFHLEFLFYVGFFIIIAQYAFVYSGAYTLFIQQFAERKGLAYNMDAEMNTVSGRLFDIGRSREISQVMSGMYESKPLRIYNYRYKTGSGKSTTIFNFTVFEISFNKTIFPHIFLQSKTMGKHIRTDRVGEVQDVKISLEEEYKKYFKLFVTKGYEIEVLQIFTHEVLSLLVTKGKKFSIEFADNKIYIFDNEHISTEKKLNQLYDVAKRLIATTGPLLDRLHDDFDALHPYYSDKDKRSN